MRTLLLAAALAISALLPGIAAAQAPIPLSPLESHVPTYGARHEAIVHAIRHDSIPADRRRSSTSGG